MLPRIRFCEIYKKKVTAVRQGEFRENVRTFSKGRKISVVMRFPCQGRVPVKRDPTVYQRRQHALIRKFSTASELLRSFHLNYPTKGFHLKTQKFNMSFL